MTPENFEDTIYKGLLALVRHTFKRPEIQQEAIELIRQAVERVERTVEDDALRGHID